MKWANVLLIIFCFSLSGFSFAQDASIDDTIEDNTQELSDEVVEDNSVESTEEVSDELAEEEMEENDEAEIAEEEPDVVESEEEPEAAVAKKPSTPKAETDFEYSPQKKRYIRHPYAKKGLIRIDKDKVYYYKTEVSPQDRASSLRFGMLDPVNLQNKEGASFSSVYSDSEAFVMLYDYEWQLWRGSLGKLGLKLGTGLYVTQGHGTFKTQTSKEPKEVLTFVVFPNNASFIYRAQFWDTQWAVPFAEGGIDYFTFAESRDDHKNPDIGARLGGALAAHAAGGMAFSLDIFGTQNRTELDREYGINSVWFTAEYRMFFGLNKTYDFTANVINAGFLVEF